MAVKTELLARICYFSGLSPGELEAVKKFIAFEKTVGKGEIFVVEDERSDYMFFVVSGAVKVYKRSLDGKEQVLNIAYPGEALNDVATFDGGPDTANMLAMTPARLYAVRKKDMHDCLAQHPKVALNIASALAGKVRRDASLVEDLSFDQVLNRLAKWLLKHVTEGADTLPLLTQHDLASMVGTSRVVVNRSLRTMEEKGAIRLERRRIVITNEDVLKELVSASWHVLSKKKKFGEAP